MIFVEAILNFDLAIFEFFESTVRMGWLNPIMKVITTLGDDGIFFIILGLVMLFFKKTRKAGLVYRFLSFLALDLIVCHF